MAHVRGSTVGIVGGSIAGCAMAVGLARLGCDVHVFERSRGALQDRGAGIMLPPALRDELIDRGYLPAGFPTCQLSTRLWIVADSTPAGRVVWRQSSVVAANNWGVLWRALRAGVPDDRYHVGVRVTEVHPDADGVTILFDYGASQQFDVLIGADGYRSLVHSHLSAIPQLDYAGYVAWRGMYPEARLAQRALLDRSDAECAWFLVGFPGGHAIVYMVPGFDGRLDPGHRRVNWLVYQSPPSGMDFTTPTSLPPGAVSPELFHTLDALLATAFPADVQAVVRASAVDEISLQPIYDRPMAAYVKDRVVVAGDAGAASRPHTGSGATKALQDALCLEDLGHVHATWQDVLAAYDAERRTAGNALVALARRIGRDQVEHTPEWATLTPAACEAWTRSTLAGEQHYFFTGVNVD